MNPPSDIWTHILFRDIVANLWNKHRKLQQLENWKVVFEEFEVTKGVIRIYISKKNRHHSGQKIPKE